MISAMNTLNHIRNFLRIDDRLPASYFVSISYMCWAYRRQGVTLDAEGKIGKWLY